MKTIAVLDNQVVKAGDLLFEIDRAPFEQALQRAQAALVIVKADVAADKASIAAAASQVDVAKSQLASAEASRAYQQTIFDDTQRLNAAGEATAKELAQAKAALAEAVAAKTSAQAELTHASAQLEAETLRVGNEAAEAARIAQAQAEVTEAQINLGYTRVVAPAAGHVTQCDLRAGQVVGVGEALFYLIESDVWWIDAKFKETQIANIKPGMPARFTVDMYPGRLFLGEVESISRGTADSFSLLPPENATGNWVKVTQRVSVRVRTKDDQPDAPLRKGASVSVTIDTEAPATRQASSPSPPQRGAPRGGAATQRDVREADRGGSK